MGIQINGSNDTIQADDGSLSLAGSVSYEDVTNVTSVGLSTFSSGIHIDDSITHLGDTNTKIRFPAADTISAETGGNERLRIDWYFGNFGIGRTPFTTAAGYVLQLRGTSFQSFLHFSTATHGDTHDDGMIVGMITMLLISFNAKISPLTIHTNNTEQDAYRQLYFGGCWSGHNMRRL